MEKSLDITAKDYRENSIFFGTIGIEENNKALKLLSEAFPERHIVIMDKKAYNSTADLFVKEHAKWQQQEAMREHFQNPENLKRCFDLAISIQKGVGEDYFTTKHLVSGTQYDYKQANASLDYLFAAGFLARKTESGTVWHKLIISMDGKIAHIEELKRQLTEESKEFTKMIKHFKSEKEKAEKKLDKIGNVAGTPVIEEEVK